MSGGTRNHNRVCANFFKLLDDVLADRSCEVYIVNVKVQVESAQKYFYPDVVVTCDERDTNPQLIQFPCLIIEVLSPSTEAVDRGKSLPNIVNLQPCKNLSTSRATLCRSVSAQRTRKMGAVRV